MNAELKQGIKACRSFTDLRRLLAEVDSRSLGPRDIDLIYRTLRKCEEDADLKLAYLGNHTLDPFARYVAAAALSEGIMVDEYIGAFGQHYQEVADPASALVAFAPDVIFLTLSMKGLSPQIRSQFMSLSRSDRQLELQRILDHMRDWVDATKQRLQGTIVITNWPQPASPQAGIADAQLDFGECEFYLELNLQFLRAFKDDPRVYVFDLDRALARCGTHDAYDPKMYYLAKMDWSEAALPEIAGELTRVLKALKGQARKCLVLDLDNTLWGGVVGEDGPMGVKIGHGDPEGEAFMEFQRVVRSLKERGIVLAICSKNNEEDAQEVFVKRPEMPLKWEDFSVRQINWEHKHDNLQSIAELLNIGIDSLVFIDDNPVECELVREMLPEVKTILLPPDPSEHAGILSRSSDFEKFQLTDEDRKKSLLYSQNADRRQSRHGAPDLKTFLEGLKTVVEITPAQDNHIPRVHQLFSKTNQFNLTTKRYQLSDIESFLETDGWDLSVVDVKDKFGSLGIVGLYLVQKCDQKAIIDSFILSCRAMGRGIETVMMNKIKNDYLNNSSASSLEAEFVSTKKNKPAASFYDEQGFGVTDKFDGGVTYGLRRENVEILACAGVAI